MFSSKLEQFFVPSVKGIVEQIAHGRGYESKYDSKYVSHSKCPQLFQSIRIRVCKPTFLPPPDSDRMFRIDSYRYKELASSTEINVVHSFGMEAT